MRLAQPRIVRSLAVSPSGAFLISVNPNTINICQTAHLHRGFAVHLDSPESLTTLAFHPTENYFATGNERGQIRLWYDVLENRDGEEATIKPASKKGAATALFHWHAHAVSSLAFTPNGAYLLSGGEEAVMVLWQLHTGHHEFVPRLGAPILTLSITDSVSNEQQVAARLRDGTVVFVGSQKLKISKTISGIKADPVRLSDLVNRPQVRVPLAVQPFTKSLVLPAGHPSSLQFYSPSEDAQLLELEVSPSNRVSSAGATPVEPTRVELVAFSAPSALPGSRTGSYWMATLDTWTNGSFAPARHLKFWQHRSNDTSFSLSTRIDRPHDAPITSMSFSPSTTSPLLLTTSADGHIKVWSFIGDSWRCRTSLRYRDFTPVDAAWSRDGSMFAVAHSRSVTLWSLADNALIHAFPCSGIAPTRTVEFVGEEGTALLAGGAHGTMVWDLLTFEETFSMSFEVNAITAKPRSTTFIATEKPSRRDHLSSDTSSTAFVINVSSSSPSCKSRQLPFPVRQSMWLDSTVEDKENDEVSLAVVNDKGEVSLVGSAAKVGMAVLPTRLPSASTAGQSRLFDDIFGSEATSTKPKQAVIASAVRPSQATTSLDVLDTPSHSLPPARMLWRTMLGRFAVGKPAKVEVGGAEVNVGGKETVAPPAVKAAVTTTFAPSPDALAKIFRSRCAIAVGSKETIGSGKDAKDAKGTGK